MFDLNSLQLEVKTNKKPAAGKPRTPREKTVTIKLVKPALLTRKLRTIVEQTEAAFIYDEVVLLISRACNDLAQQVPAAYSELLTSEVITDVSAEAGAVRFTTIVGETKRRIKFVAIVETNKSFVNVFSGSQKIYHHKVLVGGKETVFYTFAEDVTEDTAI